MKRTVTKNSFDIYYTPCNWRENLCIDKLIEKFVNAYGEENISLNEFDISIQRYPRHSLGRHNSVIVQHTATRKWALWDTGVCSETRNPSFLWGILDYRNYLLPYHSFPARDMIMYCSLKSPTEEFPHPEELTEYSWPKLPWAGQTTKFDDIDRAYEQNYDALPYVVFRGHPWSQFSEKHPAQPRGRLPFMNHLVDISKSRNLKEIVVSGGDIHHNMESLPDPSTYLSRRKFVEEIARSSGCISLPGGADVSNRDYETAGVGRAVIRPPYVVGIWGEDDPDHPFLYSTPCLKAFETKQERKENWWGFYIDYLDDDLIRQSCEDMVESALELIADKEKQKAMRVKARAWFEKYTTPDNIAQYLFDSMKKAFDADLEKWKLLKHL
tara:strand:- start:825 stop:1973 length:1149 start_codon:yes stop_codon:yes gene_type:complete